MASTRSRTEELWFGPGGGRLRTTRSSEESQIEMLPLLHTPRLEKWVRAAGQEQAAVVCCSVSKALGSTAPPDLTNLRLLKLSCLYEGATVIQKWWRGRRARELCHQLRLQRDEQIRRNAAASKIQALWRGYRARQEAILQKYIHLHQIAREAAAKRIQRAWTRWRERQDSELKHLVDLITRLRNVSATVIQKWWRGIRVRRIIDEEWNQWVVKWVWDKPGNQVQIVGDFTTPPWTEAIPMEFCSLRKCYVARMPRRPGRYQLKFLVDGRLVCCGGGTVIEDGAGHYNNVFDVYQVPHPSPFQKCRELATRAVARRSMTSPQRKQRGEAHWRRRSKSPPAVS